MELHSEVLSASIISDIINQIIGNALEISDVSSTDDVLKSFESKVDECAEEVAVEDIKNDEVMLSTEVIKLPENGSDCEIEVTAKELTEQEMISDDIIRNNEEDTAKKTEIKTKELVVREKINENDDNPNMLTAKKISLPEEKSDTERQNEDVNTENIGFDVFLQDMVNDDNSTNLTDEEALWPECDVDSEVNVKQITIVNSLSSSSESAEMTDDEVENDIPSEEELHLVDKCHVDNDNGEEISGDGGFEGFKVDEQGMDDAKEQIFQETEDAKSPAFVDTNTAANICLSHLGGAESKIITKDVPVTATDQGEFYSNEILHKMGYTLATFRYNRVLTNQSLFSNTVNLDNCQIECMNLPNKMMESHLIPLFDKFGKVFELKMVLAQENRYVHHVYVTYTTEEDANKAIQALHYSIVQGRLIKVLKYSPDAHLFVAGIPNSATERELFDKFGNLMDGLKNVFFIESRVKAGKNRGFCFLEFLDHEKTKKAKRFINRNIIFGRQLACQWTHKRFKKNKEVSEASSSTLHLSNLDLKLRSTDLRKVFSVYGEVMIVDKNGSVATVMFRNSNDARRAFYGINVTMLGDNVEISRKLRFSTNKKMGLPATALLTHNKTDN